MRLRQLLTAVASLLCIAAVARNNPATPTVEIPDYSAYIRTPAAPLTPRINSAKVFGVRPGAEILYTIAATGERPMKFTASILLQSPQEAVLR